MSGLNLLPWRAKAYRTNLKYLLLRLLVILAVFIFGYLLLLNQQTQLQATMDMQQQQWQRLNQQQAEVQSKIEQQRRQLVLPEDAAVLFAKDVAQYFQLLAELPLKGELASVRLDGQSFEMQGSVDNQQDFSVVHQFLKQHCGEVNLLKLNNESQGIEFALQTSCKEDK